MNISPTAPLKITQDDYNYCQKSKEEAKAAGRKFCTYVLNNPKVENQLRSIAAKAPQNQNDEILQRAVNRGLFMVDKIRNKSNPSGEEKTSKGREVKQKKNTHNASSSTFSRCASPFTPSSASRPVSRPVSGPSPSPASGPTLRPSPSPASGPAPRPSPSPASGPAPRPSPSPASGPVSGPASGPVALISNRDLSRSFKISARQQFNEDLYRTVIVRCVQNDFDAHGDQKSVNNALHLFKLSRNKPSAEELSGRDMNLKREMRFASAEATVDSFFNGNGAIVPEKSLALGLLSVLKKTTT